MVIWDKLVASHSDLDTNLHVIHLLWMLMYFKSYSNEEEYCVKASTCVRTFREKVWYLANKIALLPIVSTKNKIIFIYVYMPNYFFKIKNS